MRACHALAFGLGFAFQVRLRSKPTHFGLSTAIPAARVSCDSLDKIELVGTLEMFKHKRMLALVGLAKQSNFIKFEVTV